MASIINASSSGSGGIVQTADASGVLQLQTNGTVALTVSSSQKIGIGTASPTVALDVQAVAGNSAPFFSLTATSLSSLGAQNWISSAFASSMTAGTIVSHWIGKAGATADSGYIGYKYAGTTGSTSNRMEIGTFNNDACLNVYAGGWVTMPYQPAFMATGIGTVFNSSSWALLPFTTEIYDSNSNYDPTTAKFTAPIAGKYFFTWGALTRGTTAGSRTAIYKNGTKYYDSGNTNSSQTYSSVNSENMISSSYILNLAAGDYVQIYGIVSSGTGDIYLSGNSHNVFAGYLIG